MQVLLIEDDSRLAAALAELLRLHGMRVDHAGTAQEALERISGRTEAVVLDLGLPDRDGFEVCRRIRERYDVPILMATARSDLASRVHGLNLGADDFLVKPFDFRELIARMHAVTRRQRRLPVGVAGPDGGQDSSSVGPALDPDRPATGAPIIASAELTVFPQQRLVLRAGEPVSLTRKEFDLLALLCREPGVVFRREQIVSEVWHSMWTGMHRSLEVHVAAVRSKTGDPGLIQTVRGVGYRLRPR